MLTNDELEKKFYELKTRNDVAKILEIEDRSLRYFLYGIKPEYMYSEFVIAKRNGGERKICAPDKKLKNIQKKLSQILNIVYKRKPSVYGFVNNETNISNAKNHVNDKYVFNLDLKDFFTQIHFGRIKGLLEKKPYSLGEEAALVIAQITCFKGCLPQGAPTSPILTNMICSSLDNQLTRFAKKNRVMYTRYADDITFSSSNLPFSKDIVYEDEFGVYVGEKLLHIIQNNSFIINNEKVKLFKKDKRQEVTGLVVNKFVNVKREYIKEIRAILNNCERFGMYDAVKKYAEQGLCKSKAIINALEDIDALQLKNSADNEEKIKKMKEMVFSYFEKALAGRIRYIANVRGYDNGFFLKYASQLNHIFDKNIFDIEVYQKLLERIKRTVFILESNTCQGTGFLVKNIGLFTNHHVVEDQDFYKVNSYESENKGMISLGNPEQVLKDSRDIDYTIFKWDKEEELSWELDESELLKIGDKVILVGYPLYTKGNKPTIEYTSINGTRKRHGNDIYTVSARIISGASGGVVLKHQNLKVVGIIICGGNSMQENENDDIISGFIPIHQVNI